MLIHQRKTVQLYHFFAARMVGLCPEMVTLQAYGTDGEKALTLSRMHGFFQPQSTLDTVTFPILVIDCQTFFYFVAKR